MFIQEQVELMSTFLESADVLFVRAVKTRISNKISVQIKEGVQLYYKQIGILPKLNLFFFELWSRHYEALFDYYIEQNSMPDLLHGHGYLGGLVVAHLAEKKKLPYVITIHDTSLISEKLKTWKIELLTKALKNAAAVISVSNFLRSKLEELYKTDNVHVIPNFVHPRFFDKKLKQNAGPIFNFGIIGSLDKRKRVSMIVDSFQYLEDKLKQKIKIHIAGDGKERKRIERMVKLSKLENNIYLKGWVPRTEIVDFIDNMDCLLSLSALETFGISLIEAMAMGKPVISSNSGGVLDIVTPKTGILLQEINPNTLAVAMNEISLLSIDSDFLRNYVHEKFGAETVSNTLMKIYLQVC